MAGIRDKAKTVLAQVPLTGDVRSDLNPALFKTLTNGVTHDILMQDWKGGGIRTVCIDFVCWYAAQMGIDILSGIDPKKSNPKVDGFFALKETLKKCGKEYAWVATNAEGPKFGDILRHTAFHVDIALGFDEKVLLRAAGGQKSSHPRPSADVSKEYDNVMRVRGAADYDFHKLEGWLDLDKFFGPPPGAAPQTPGAGKTGLLWINVDGDVVNPNAPAGGGGPGFFRAAGVLSAVAYNDFLPHPQSNAVRTLDPLRIQRREEERIS